MKSHEFVVSVIEFVSESGECFVIMTEFVRMHVGLFPERGSVKICLKTKLHAFIDIADELLHRLLIVPLTCKL